MSKKNLTYFKASLYRTFFLNQKNNQLNWPRLESPKANFDFFSF